MTVRYYHIKQIVTSERIGLARANLIAYILGMIVCSGMTLVGNFQVQIIKAYILLW